MASPHQPQHPRHPFTLPSQRNGSPMPSNSASSSSSGIPFNTSAHNFNAPSPLAFGFGGVNHFQPQQQAQSNGNGNGGNHSVAFGGGFGQSAASSSSKISSPLSTSFGFSNTNNASTATGFQSPHLQQQWTSSPQFQQQQYTSPNTFASAFASSSRTNQSPQQTLVSPSPARTITTRTAQQSSNHTENIDNVGNAGKRRRSASEDDSMDRSSPTPHTPTPFAPTTTENGNNSGTISASGPSRSLKRARADPSTRSAPVNHHQRQHNNINDNGANPVRDADHDGTRRAVRARRDDGLAVRVGDGDGEEEEEEQGPEEEADLGVLLASLPSSTHLQILLSLLSSNPALKRAVLDLIPAPELEFAVKVLDEKCASLVGSVPVGAAGVGAAATSTAAVRRAGNGASFGSGSSTHGSIGTVSSSATTAGGTVSDGYILNRLRIPFADFVQVVLTYLPYFIGSSSPEGTSTGSASQALNGKSSTSEGKGVVGGRRQIPAPHPSITFQYLSHLTALLIQRILPILPASVLYSASSPSQSTSTPPQLPHLPILLRSLENAWRTWLERVSEHVNVRAGMYAASMAHEWISGIEELRDAAVALVARGPADQQERREAGQKVEAAGRLVGSNNISHANNTTSGKTDHLSSSSAATTLSHTLAQLADAWVEQVGWLIGRSPSGGQEAGASMMVDQMDEQL
ncbi:hypothetical protein QFC22_004116 [Naganishia vaughanmartiniae]|uniref:Uncharacterized protein n=1 Tax=Naganishia vaughanmartiniae TaxID=1424756 RepID=A0ACC2X2F3_9TREE|nr:hypothetical protein QFC22_004116 [Naganishia vaughanmartiniae]